MRWGAIALLAVACGHAPAPVAVGNTGGSVPDAGPAPRCLPVVAAECGCSYECAAGVPSGARWKVSWRGGPIDADIKPWCVGTACTDAFHGDIVCDGICAPKPADPGCHFDGAGACVGTGG